MSVQIAFFIIALFLFFLAAIKVWEAGKISLGWMGMFFLTLAFLVGGFKF